MHISPLCTFFFKEHEPPYFQKSQLKNVHLKLSHVGKCFLPPIFMNDVDQQLVFHTM